MKYEKVSTLIAVVWAGSNVRKWLFRNPEDELRGRNFAFHRFSVYFSWELNGGMADFKYDVAVNSTNLSSLIIPHVFERYSEDQLYGTYRPVVTLFNKYVTPVWYVIGFPSNAISFIVWIQPRMRPSSGCYLTALALADFIFLILQLCYELQSTWNVRLLTYPVICQGFPVFFYASQYLSPLLVLGKSFFSVHRSTSTLFDLRLRRCCHQHRTHRRLYFTCVVTADVWWKISGQLTARFVRFHWVHISQICIVSEQKQLWRTEASKLDTKFQVPLENLVK